MPQKNLMFGTITSNIFFNKIKNDFKRLVLTPLVVICLSTLILLTIISVLQLIFLNKDFLCRYEFFSHKFSNALTCKVKKEFNTESFNNRFKKKPTYFYDPLAIEVWGREEEETTSKLKSKNLLLFLRGNNCSQFKSTTP